MIRRDTLRDLLAENEPMASVSLWSTKQGRRILKTASAYERELWFVVISAMLVDVTLTVHGLHLGLKEMNPVARAGMATLGVPVLYGLKAVALALGAVCASVIPDRYTALVPLGLALPSLGAVIINITILTYVAL